MSHVNATRRRAAFTLVELLFVMGIIAILVSILIPVVGSLRKRAQGADSSNWIAQLSNAVNNYYQDFKAYPGPLGNDETYRSDGYFTSNTSFLANFPGRLIMDPQAAGGEYRDFGGTNGTNNITMSENLVLGLLGGLRVSTTGTRALVYDPRQVGAGPSSLNPNNPKKYTRYIDPINLSWQTIGNERTGEFFDDASVGTGPNVPVGADDSVIPEFVDRFSDPLPVIYLRAKRGANRTASPPTEVENAVITDGDVGANERRVGQYDLTQLSPYTEPPAGAGPIGVGKKLPKYVSNGSVANQPPNGNVPPNHGLRSVNPTATTVNDTSTGTCYLYPYDAFAYLRNPQLSGPNGTGTVGTQIAREKDKFILISAGPDRVYGTNDDITSFGSVVP